jgi:hypothetical protein
MNSPQTLSLMGSGVDFSLTANGTTSLTIASGQNAVYPLRVDSASSISGKVEFTCTGAPANSTCNITPTETELGNTTTVSATVLTGVSSAGYLWWPMSKPSKMVWFASLLPVGLLILGGKRRSFFVSVVCLCCLIAITGCGAGRKIPDESGPNPSSGANPITTAGKYTITVSATSAGLTRTVDLTLIVQ